jgi:SAM-dependent methyltransferase
MTFDAYAAFYDLLYQDKGYAEEARYVDRILRAIAPQARRMMEFGCGTGRYSREFLELGYNVTGIDRSKVMLAQAFDRCRSATLSKRADFELGDLRDYRREERFDAVAALFHVMSYQTQNADLLAGFQTAREHLDPGGLFVFDAWYGPGVLSDPPRNPVKFMENDRVAATRRTTSRIHPNDNTVRVRFELEIVDKRTGSPLPPLTEEHLMRYLFLPEVRGYGERCGLELISAFHWLTGREPGLGTWYAFFVLKAV